MSVQSFDLLIFLGLQRKHVKSAAKKKISKEASNN